MIRVDYVKNALAFGGLIVLACILFIFINGSFNKNKILGTWKAIDIQDEIVFTETNCTLDNSTIEYKIHGNQIILSNGERYFFTLTEEYLEINEILYMRID